MGGADRAVVRAVWRAGGGGILAIGVMLSCAARADADGLLTGKALAQRIFRQADRQGRGYLDDRSLREARRLLRSALERDVHLNFPASENMRDDVLQLVAQGAPDRDEDGKTTEEEFIDFVMSLKRDRDAYLTQARQRVAFKQQLWLKRQDMAYKALLEEMQREMRESQRRRSRR